MKIKSKKLITAIKSHKRMSIVILSLVLLIVAFTGVILYSSYSWNQYSQRYSQEYYGIKNDIDSVLSNTSKDKVSGLVLFQSGLDRKMGSFCKIDNLVSWQSFVKQNMEKTKECEQKKEHLEQLSDDLGKLNTYLVIEAKLSNILSDVNKSTNKNNSSDKWALIEPLWRQASSDITKLSDYDQFKPIKTATKDRVTKIADIWGQLAKANKDKNRQKFEEANTSLKKAYLNLATIANDSKAKSNKLILSFSDSYFEAFQ